MECILEPAVQRSQRILVHSRRLVRISKLIETSNTIIFESPVRAGLRTNEATLSQL